MDLATCKSCGERIAWIRMAKTGKPMPVDPAPRLTLVTERGEVVSGYRSHFSTCSEADQHRRGR